MCLDCFTLKPNQQLHVRLQPTSGDADLYIWPPDHQTRAAWASISVGWPWTSWSTISAPVGGVYQVEVYGYLASDFQVQIDSSDACQPTYFVRTHHQRIRSSTDSTHRHQERSLRRLTWRWIFSRRLSGFPRTFLSDLPSLLTLFRTKRPCV